MKRELEENGEIEGPPQKHMYGPMQHYGGWQPRVQGNMRGGVNTGGGGGGGGGSQGGFRGGRGGPWRGPRMPNNHGPRGYFRGGRGRGGPPRYPYDNTQQPYQKSQWHQPQQQYSHDHHHQHPENDHVEMDSNPSGNSCMSGGNCTQGSTSNMCSWNGRLGDNDNKLGNAGSGNVADDTNSNMIVVEESYTKTKVKRRPMSQNYSSKPWNREDAERALAVESAHMKGLRNQSLIIRFPDPELSKDMVKNFHPGIENVHFQVPSGPRYCFVQLAEDVNPDSAIKELSKIKFGSGKLLVEKKFSKEEEDLSPEAIDPYTLYIGNLPTNVNVATVKDKFPTASRVDVGFAQRMKFTRYAFIRYTSVDDAIQAYKCTHNLILDSRSIIVRFRRVRGPVGLPGESRQQKPPKAQKKEPAKVKKDAKTENNNVVEALKKESLKKKEAKIEKEKEKSKKRDDDDDDDEDDDDDDDEEEDDDDDEEEEDDDDDDSDDDDDDDDDDDEEDDDDMGPDAADDDPDDSMDEDEDDEENDDDDDDDENDLSQRLFQQIDAQIQHLD